MENYIQRFLLENLDIRGVLVHLDSVWQEMTDNRHYPASVSQLLGEICATTLLIGNNLKQKARLTIQMTGDGPISMLIIDCNQDLQVRGMVKCKSDIHSLSIPELITQGQLVLTLDLPAMRESYQSIVSLDGNNIAEIFEHYFDQSEQLPSRLFLIATDTAIFGMLLQKLPTTDHVDPDGWARAEALASTIHYDHSLLHLTSSEILGRLFSEETVRIFERQTVHNGCQENPAKIYDMLRLLGRKEVESILDEHGEVIVNDEICNREYRIDALTVAAIFKENDPTIH